MAFYHVKVIKGNPYLYRETRWRGEGGQVEGKTEYIGPLNSLLKGGGKSSGSGKKQDEQAIKNIQKAIQDKTGISLLKSEIAPDVIDIRKKIKELGKQEKTEQPKEKFKKINDQREPEKVVAKKVTLTKKAKKATKPKATEKPKVKPPIPFKTKFDLAGHKISAVALVNTHERTIKMLDRLGLDTSKMPEITFKYGGHVTGYRKNFFGKGLTVFLSEGKNTRTRFNFEYKKALARASLELMEKQDPKRFKELKKQFTHSYTNTKKNLRSFVKHSQPVWKTKKKKKDLGFYKLGQVSKLLKKYKISPREMGLIDYSPCSDWKDDATTALADVIGKGFVRAKKERERYVKESLSERIRTEKITDNKSGVWSTMAGKAKRADKYFYKANAQYEMQKEANKKIDILENILSK